MVQCKRCNKNHDGNFGSGIFCSRSCANARVLTEKHKDSIRKSLIKEDAFENVKCESCEKEFKAYKRHKARFCSKTCSNKSKWINGNKRNATAIWQLSARTRCKILKRIGKGCCRCGWNEAPCDLHHIRGRKVQNPDADSNLALLCPNCHRLFHSKKIGPDDVVSLDIYIPNWLDYYYG